MVQTIIGGLLSNPAPTAQIVGIAFIALFASEGGIVGPDYNGKDATALTNSKKQIKIDLYLISNC